MTTELKMLILEEHHQAEMLRLRAGFDGCGCADCQTLYATLDLEKYGKRVIRVGGFIGITEGRAGADLWNKYHPAEHWSPDGNLFVIGGEKYGLTETGRTVCVGLVEVTETAPDAPKTIPAPEEGCDTAQRGVMLGQGRVTDDVTVIINELSAQGNSTRAIEKELAKEGVFISYRTVARIVSGERML